LQDLGAMYIWANANRVHLGALIRGFLHEITLSALLRGQGWGRLEEAEERTVTRSKRLEWGRLSLENWSQHHAFPAPSYP
jgi:hypothetical protein